MNDYELILKYNDISKSNKPKIPQYYGDMFIDVEAEYLMRKKFQQRIDKAIEYINYMFDKANENDIIDDLLKIEKILKGSKE